MKRSISPLRYPGGKASIFSMTNDIIESHGYIGGQYIEPYAGGCGLALTLFFKGVVSELHLNDIDRSIWALWHTILNDTDRLVNRLIEIPINMNEWYIQKEIQDNKDKSEVLDLAVSTLYLNRTNRSGIIKAGVIGGKKQDGNYKMDCRFNRERLAEQIIHISKSRDKISFHNMDAVDFINYIEELGLNNPILMVDPPYYNKGQSLYTNFYKHNDHANIADKLKETSLPWLLTYDNTSEISELYSEFSQYNFSINYSAAKKRIGTELFITSHDFNVIEHELLNTA